MSGRNRLRICSAVIAAACWLSGIAGRNFLSPSAMSEDLIPAVGKPTLGGVQFWNDRYVYFGWRVQENVISKNCRLIDEKNRSFQEGTYDDCLVALERVKKRDHLAPMSGKVVLILHGLVGTQYSSTQLDRAFEKEGYVACCLTYASTWGTIAEHAANLANIVEHLGPDVREVNFVAHSMGNLVIRHYLADQSRGCCPDPRIHRIVMLGPPNHGAFRAHLWADSGFLSKPFKLVVGPAADELSTGFAELEKRLTIPDCEFGIIAGGLGDKEGWHDKIAGDDDGTVGVEEARLAGAADFLVVPVRHRRLNNDDKVISYTVRFIEHGFFQAEKLKRPIPRDAPAE